MKVMIAVDASEHSEFAVKWYLGRHISENEVLLVHVSELIINPEHGFTAGLGLQKDEWEAMMTESLEVDKSLEKFSSVLERKGISHKCSRVQGKPGPSLCDVAAGEDVNMIVMGTRGMGTVDSHFTFLGSVSDYVLHHADIPVLICRK